MLKKTVLPRDISEKLQTLLTGKKKKKTTSINK